MLDKDELPLSSEEGREELLNAGAEVWAGADGMVNVKSD